MRLLNSYSGYLFPLCGMALACAAGAVLLMVGPALAQPGGGSQPVGDGVVPASATAEADDAETSFEALYQRLEGSVNEMEDLRRKFGAASAAERMEIAREHDSKVDSLVQLLGDVKAAAESEFAANPQIDSKQAEFLADVLTREVQADRYEEADRLGRLFTEHNATPPKAVEAAGIAAFMANDYARAERLFDAAAESGKLGLQGRQYLQSLDYYKKIWEEEKAYRAAEALADDLPRVKFETNKGDIIIELFENEAPNTVANLISLVDKKYYDGLTFHRVLPGFMAQGGCPDGTGGGGPGYNIKCECRQAKHRKHFRGSLSMAKTSAPNTGGSQFFLCFVPTQHLDGQHTVFGRVIEGLDVLAELQQRDPSSPFASQITPDRIEKATVIRRRDHEYSPETLPET